jgi:hypothetical protein
MIGLFLCLRLSAQAPPGYYDSAEGKVGVELRQALHNIIRNHHVIPYSSSTRTDTSDALKVLDEDAANTNNVILLYAQRSEPKSTFGLHAMVLAKRKSAMKAGCTYNQSL